MAAQSRGSVKVFVQLENGSLDAMAIAERAEVKGVLDLEGETCSSR